METIGRILRALGLFKVALYLHDKFLSPISVVILRIRYARQLERIRAKPKHEKIRVLFVVSEQAKWKCQKLYDLMKRSDVFYPMVCVAGWNRLDALTCPDTRKLMAELDRNMTYFKRIGVECVCGTVVEDGLRRDLSFSEFSPDIVYINEPWGPARGVQSCQSISHYALTAFTPYYVPNYGVVDQECHGPLHRYLFLYFCLNKWWADLFESSYRRWQKVVRFVPMGHPAMDYFDANIQGLSERLIVYAPHFSFVHPKQETLLQCYSTIDWNGREILEYAKKHHEYRWVFKPHPLLKEALNRTGLFDADDYYAEWSKIGEVCEAGDYQDLFLKSYLMITDCGSFLTEYAATGKPIIHLICKDNIREPPMPSKKVYATYYQVHNLDEMYATFALVLENGKDPRMNERQAAEREAGLMNSHASEKILEYLRRLLRR